MAISEEVSMELEAFVKVALDGIKSNSGGELEIKQLEYRIVKCKPRKSQNKGDKISTPPHYDYNFTLRSSTKL